MLFNNCPLDIFEKVLWNLNIKDWLSLWNVSNWCQSMIKCIGKSIISFTLDEELNCIQIKTTTGRIKNIKLSDCKDFSKDLMKFIFTAFGNSLISLKFYIDTNISMEIIELIELQCSNNVTKLDLEGSPLFIRDFLRITNFSKLENLKINDQHENCNRLETELLNEIEELLKLTFSKNVQLKSFSICFNRLNAIGINIFQSVENLQSLECFKCFFRYPVMSLDSFKTYINSLTRFSNSLKEIHFYFRILEPLPNEFISETMEKIVEVFKLLEIFDIGICLHSHWGPDLISYNAPWSTSCIKPLCNAKALKELNLHSIDVRQENFTDTLSVIAPRLTSLSFTRCINVNDGFFTDFNCTLENLQSLCLYLFNVSVSCLSQFIATKCLNLTSLELSWSQNVDFYLTHFLVLLHKHIHKCNADNNANDKSLTIRASPGFVDYLKLNADMRLQLVKEHCGLKIGDKNVFEISRCCTKCFD